MTGSPLTPEELRKTDAYWRACNYLALGMIYLQDNPLLKEPLKPEHIKNRLLGHWGSSPGLAFTLHPPEPPDQEVRPGHDLHGRARPRRARRAGARLSGGHLLRDLSGQERGRQGLREFFKQFSFPGGIGSHCTPETPGSIHEGGELGYVLSHACGAAFDNPDLIVAAVVGDGESETGPLATSWHISKFLNPIRDGAVLPILHLNGYKINNPTLLARITHEELEELFAGYGWTPYFVEGSDPETHAPGDGGDASSTASTRSGSISGNAGQTGVATPAALADDRAALPQGMGRTEGSRRPQARRLLARPPGAAGRRQEEPRTTADPRKVDARAEAGGAVR